MQGAVLQKLISPAGMAPGVQHEAAVQWDCKETNIIKQ